MKGATIKSKSLVVMLALSLPGALLALDTSAAANAKKKAGPVVVATDPADDWGANVDPNIAPAGDALGQELVEATMQMADRKTVNFIIKLKSLPEPGGVPEFTRYGWEFSVGGEEMVITGAFTEFIRGFCYPPHSEPGCPPNAGDPAQAMDAPFFVRQRVCGLGEACVVRAVVNSTFDPATGMITVPVPLDAIDAQPGSKIEPLTDGLYSGTIYAALGAPVGTIGAAPHDTMVVTESFVVPSWKKK